VTEQGYPPRHPDHPGRGGRPRVPREARNSGWQELDAFAPGAQEESDVPPWAIPGGVEPIRPVRRATRTVEAVPAVDRQPPGYPAPDQPVRSGRHGMPGLPDQSGRPDEPARPDGPGRPNGPGRQGGPGRRERSSRSQPPGPGVFDDDSAFSEPTNLPGEPRLPDPGARRPRRSRAAKTRRRRGRRRLVTWGSAAIVIVVLVGLGIYLASPTPKPQKFVTTLQKGEFKIVPNTCKAISALSLSQFLAGKPSKSVQTANSATNSECTYQVDAKPIFRVLDVNVQASTPNLIAPGNGSATSNAVYSFAQDRQALAKPSKHTAQPPATIRSVPGLGSRAFSAAQIYHQGGVIDRVTVELQYRNVVITVKLWANDSDGFGPVTTGQLQLDAETAARGLLATVKTQPTES
jgi:hypothetical protein